MPPYIHYRMHKILKWVQTLAFHISLHGDKKKVTFGILSISAPWACCCRSRDRTGKSTSKIGSGTYRDIKLTHVTFCHKSISVWGIYQRRGTCGRYANGHSDRLSQDCRPCAWDCHSCCQHIWLKPIPNSRMYRKWPPQLLYVYMFVKLISIYVQQY